MAHEVQRRPNSFRPQRGGMGACPIGNSREEIILKEKTVDPTIYMVGPSFKTQGGISSVLGIYKSSFPDRFRLVFIPTYSGNSRLMDGMLFSLALVRILMLSVFVKNSIFHIHTASKGSFLRKSLIAALPAAFGRKFIYHIHGAMFDRFMEEGGRDKMESILRKLSRADKVIVLSKSWFEYFRRFLPAEKLEVVYNPSSTYDGNYISRANPRPVLLFMGRFGQRKGTYDLLKAAAKLEPDSFTLKMYGDGETEEVRRFVENNGLQASVEVNGWVSHQEVGRLYDAADVLVLPSYAEGLPMSVLEAIGKGMPVVSTNVGGIPEAVIDGENGYIVAPGDVEFLAGRLTQLLKDAVLREKMGRRSLAIAKEKFSVESIGSKLESVYKEVSAL